MIVVDTTAIAAASGEPERERINARLARAATNPFEAGMRCAAGRASVEGGIRPLNYGDCFAYALAIVRGAPLLCVGGDFERTDVQLA